MTLPHINSGKSYGLVSAPHDGVFAPDAFRQIEVQETIGDIAHAFREAQRSPHANQARLTPEAYMAAVSPHLGNLALSPDKPIGHYDTPESDGK